MAVALRLSGPLDAAVLERVLGEVVRRHEALRTTLTADEGEPVQVVAPPGPWRLETDDIAGLGEAEREAEVRRRARADALSPFDLEAGPLLRTSLLREGEREARGARRLPLQQPRQEEAPLLRCRHPSRLPGRVDGAAHGVTPRGHGIIPRWPRAR
jgi:hypothetical protein